MLNNIKNNKIVKKYSALNSEKRTDFNIGLVAGSILVTVSGVVMYKLVSASEMMTDDSKYAMYAGILFATLGGSACLYNSACLLKESKTKSQPQLSR